MGYWCFASCYCSAQSPIVSSAISSCYSSKAILPFTASHIPCPPGNISVIGRAYSNIMIGRVAICVEGVWRTVCSTNWSINSTQVVCRDLGYSAQSKGFPQTGTHSYVSLLTMIGVTYYVNYYETFMGPTISCALEMRRGSHNVGTLHQTAISISVCNAVNYVVLTT